MRRQRLAQMSTGVLLIALSAGCSSGSKPNPAPASSGSPTVAAPQATTPPTTQPTVGSGPMVTLTSLEGYVYKLQASPYTGPPITVQTFNDGGVANAPPGKVFIAVTVTISDGLPGRGEPLDLLLGRLTFAVPTSSAAAFDMSAQVDVNNGYNSCSHDIQPSTMWCELFTELTGPVPGQPGGLGPSAPGGSQLQPGQPVSLLLATRIPVPQSAPMAKLTLFAKLPGGNAVQVPVSTSG
jgi:hypothetical protein